MFENLTLIRLSGGLAGHAETRQALVAENVANADTPGYRARDLGDFAAVIDERRQTALRSTRAGHFGQTNTPVTVSEARILDAPGAASPNGNSVSIETEMMRASQIRHQHEMALGVYQKTLGILRTSLGRGR